MTNPTNEETKMSNANSTRVITGVVRCSYVHVFEARQNVNSGKDEYSMTLLIPKSDTETVAKLKAAMDAAISAKWGAKPPAHLQKPIHDGDGQKPLGGPYSEECEGHWVLNVKSNSRPGIVDANVAPIMDRAEFQSGDYARVSLNAYAYDNKRVGVSFGLNNIQVIRKGEPLSGRTRAEDDFGPADGVQQQVAAGNPW